MTNKIICNLGRFRQYDYGAKKNLLIYNSTHPPEYKLSNIKAPVALYYGINDKLMNIQVNQF